MAGNSKRARLQASPIQAKQRQSQSRYGSTRLKGGRSHENRGGCSSGAIHGSFRWHDCSYPGATRDNNRLHPLNAQLESRDKLGNSR